MGRKSRSARAGADLTNADPKELANRFVDFAELVLADREREGVRGIKAERNRFATHLANAAFALKPMGAISRDDIEAWFQEMNAKRPKGGDEGTTLSGDTIRRSSALCSEIFRRAGPTGYSVIAQSPYVGLVVEEYVQPAASEDAFEYLRLEEQKAFETCAEISDADRLPVLFAIGTGLGHGEQFGLKVRDLRLDGRRPHVVLREGSAGRTSRQSKAEHAVPLLGPSLDAAKRWLQVLPEFAQSNPEALLFPTATGLRLFRLGLCGPC